MKTYNPNKPVISSHIPKCGGKSLLRVLASWFRHRLYVYKPNARVQPGIRFRFFDLFRVGYCFHGHFDYSKGRGGSQVFPTIDQCFTFIRDPLEHALSFFYYNKFRKRDPVDLRLTGIKDGLVIRDVDEFLETQQGFLSYYIPSEYWSNPDQLSNYYLHIGIVEDYQASLNILARKLGKQPISLPHINTTKRNATPSESSVKIFRERAANEYNFYNKILELHQREK